MMANQFEVSAGAADWGGQPGSLGLSEPQQGSAGPAGGSGSLEVQELSLLSRGRGGPGGAAVRVCKCDLRLFRVVIVILLPVIS